MTYTLSIIDYGLGNLHSVHKAFQHVAAQVKDDWKIQVVQSKEAIQSADKVVFPGVGAIRDCMGGLQALDLIQELKQALESKPTLAICVGMQALMSRSEENQGVDCLNWVSGSVNRFPESGLAQGIASKDILEDKLKVPHMGWNQVKQSPHALWEGIPDQSRFYFVHSYYVPCDDSLPAKGTCHYGVDFAAAIGEKNWFAVQFHPEKSHLHGLQLLTNFLNWTPQ